MTETFHPFTLGLILAPTTTFLLLSKLDNFIILDLFLKLIVLANILHFVYYDVCVFIITSPTFQHVSYIITQLKPWSLCGFQPHVTILLPLLIKEPTTLWPPCNQSDLLPTILVTRSCFCTAAAIWSATTENHIATMLRPLAISLWLTSFVWTQNGRK